MDHYDLFLYLSDNHYLITYKVPKNNINSYGIRQKNHRLKYLAFNGELNDNESVEIIRRGLFITHGWILGYNDNNFIKLNFEELSGTFEDMWKKTDFKISLDEIKLYEVTDPKHIQTDKEISSKNVDIVPEPISDKKSANPSPEPAVVSAETTHAEPPTGPVAEAVSVEKTESEKSFEPEPENESKTEIIPDPAPENNPVAGPVKDQMKQSILVEEADITYTPVQEFILDESGKPVEEYRKK